MTNILLITDFKPTYSNFLSDKGFHPIFLPVLSHTFTNSHQLRNTLLDDAAYAGLIFTSQRAVEAWVKATSTCSNSESKWSTLPHYVVGKATADALGAVDPVFRSDHVLGKCGDADSLADFITKRHIDNGLPLLYLTGDKRRDAITTGLSNAGIQLHEVQVYATFTRPDFAQSLKEALKQHPPAWIALFSPSGANATLPLIAETGCKVQLASIGPVTSEHVQAKFGYDEIATAAQPTAQGLLDAIIARK